MTGSNRASPIRNMYAQSCESAWMMDGMTMEVPSLPDKIGLVAATQQQSFAGLACSLLMPERVYLLLCCVYHRSVSTYRYSLKKRTGTSLDTYTKSIKHLLKTYHMVHAFRAMYLEKRVQFIRCLKQTSTHSLIYARTSRQIRIRSYL